MEHLRWIVKYISANFDKVTAFSSLALAVASSIVSALTLLLTYIILKFTARPRIGIRLEKHTSLHCSETVDLCFTVWNKGHWYGRPPATGIRAYFNFSNDCELKCLRYGNTLQFSDTEPKRGKGGHVYLRAKGIAAFHEEPGETVILTLQSPPKPGTYSLRIAMSCTEGGYTVYRKKLKVVSRGSRGEGSESETHLAQWGFEVTSRSETPIIGPTSGVFLCPVTQRDIAWEKLHTFNPAAVVRNEKVLLLYRAEDDTGDIHRGSHTSRIGLAESADGTTFIRRVTPILYPEPDEQNIREWPGGCEDPRIVEAPDGTYVLTYTQWNRKYAIAAIATSTDLIHWKKHGPIFGDFHSTFGLSSYKSAGILTKLQNDRLIATQIDGQYLMYWGEGHVHLARSPDLVHWLPIRNGDGSPAVVLAPRKEHFDSQLVEVGAPPILTSDGILLMYNGMNAVEFGDPTVKVRAYSAGQALFDRTNPARLVARSDNAFLQPKFQFESTGQYKPGATFVEGLVFFKGTYFLYFGAADNFVSVATLQAPR